MSVSVVRSHLEERSTALGRLLREQRLQEAKQYALSTVDGDAYDEYLQEIAVDGQVLRDVQGHEMSLDVHDTGLSRELCWRRVHEPRSTRIWRRELKDLRNSIDGTVTVLEAGANIGYYCLIEADVLGRDADIYAVEPAPRNIDLLRQNVSRNGYDDRVSIFQLGLSDVEGEQELYISDKSNCARVGGEPEFGETVETVTIRTTTPDAFVREQGVEPQNLNVVRMDVEGYENHILRGMDEILDSETPLLLFVELHRRVKDEGDLDEVLDRLAQFDLVSGHCEPVYAPSTEIDALDEVRNFDFEKHENIELILRR